MSESSLYVCFSTLKSKDGKSERDTFKSDFFDLCLIPKPKNTVRKVMTRCCSEINNFVCIKTSWIINRRKQLAYCWIFEEVIEILKYFCQITDKTETEPITEHL